MNKINYTIKYGSLLTLIFLGLTSCSMTNNNAVKSQNQVAADYNVQLGVGYLQQGDISRSKQKLLLAVEQAPNWPPALDALAYFLETTGEPVRAEDYYKRALKIEPHSGAALNNYGAFLCRSKHYETAEKYFMLATQDPNYVNVGGVYENAGLCALKIKNYNKAASFFSKALQNDPHSSIALLEMADLKYMSAQYSDAQNYLQRYLKVAEPNTQSRILGQRLANKLGNKGQ
ncbi:type IV pilus biogenesis/stability protein PilW [soil metagenome]